MNPDKQRIAIAEACGWARKTMTSPIDGKTEIELWRELNGRTTFASIPDYLNDLNAMHEAEKVMIDRGASVRYREQLFVVAGDPLNLIAYRYLWHATAAQRAEAFLRTIGKWEDSE